MPLGLFPTYTYLDESPTHFVTVSRRIDTKKKRLMIFAEKKGDNLENANPLRKGKRATRKLNPEKLFGLSYGYNENRRPSISIQGLDLESRGLQTRHFAAG